MDTLGELKKMDADISSMTASDDGVITLSFKINGAHIKAQYDIDSRGLYAIEVASFADLQKLINGDEELWDLI
jgi:hypothetical protein